MVGRMTITMAAPCSCARRLRPAQTRVLKWVVVTITGTRPETCSRSCGSAPRAHRPTAETARKSWPGCTGRWSAVDHEINAALLADQVQLAILKKCGRNDRENALVAGLGSGCHGLHLKSVGALWPWSWRRLQSCLPGHPPCRGDRVRSGARGRARRTLPRPVWRTAKRKNTPRRSPE